MNPHQLTLFILDDCKQHDEVLVFYTSIAHLMIHLVILCNLDYWIVCSSLYSQSIWDPRSKRINDYSRLL